MRLASFGSTEFQISLPTCVHSSDDGVRGQAAKGGRQCGAGRVGRGAGRGLQAPAELRALRARGTYETSAQTQVPRCVLTVRGLAVQSAQEIRA